MCIDRRQHEPTFTWTHDWSILYIVLCICRVYRSTYFLFFIFLSLLRILPAFSAVKSMQLTWHTNVDLSGFDIRIQIDTHSACSITLYQFIHISKKIVMMMMIVWRWSKHHTGHSVCAMLKYLGVLKMAGTLLRNSN